MAVVYQYKDRKFLFSSLLGLLIILCVIFFSSFVLAVEKDAGEPEKAGADGENNIELNFEVVQSEYEYQIESRPDPFNPFFSGETTTEQPALDPNEIIEDKAKLTGMQLFEPGQLTLVALLKTKNKYIAMVEDFTGRGYVIKEGMKIGRRGVVKSILPNKVLIEEVAVTRAGRELKNETVMALRKEGEE